MNIFDLVPSALIITLGVAALLTLFSAQRKARQVDMEHSFQLLRVVAYGVQHSNWPASVLVDEIEKTKTILHDTEAPSMLEALLQGVR